MGWRLSKGDYNVTKKIYNGNPVRVAKEVW